MALRRINPGLVEPGLRRPDTLQANERAAEIDPCITCTKPAPSAPSRFVRGTCTSSKKIEPRPIALLPRSVNWLVATPAAFMGTRKALMPWARSSMLPVRAKTRTASAWSAMLIEDFSPLST